MNTYKQLRDMILSYNSDNHYMGSIMLIQSGFIKSMTLLELDELYNHIAYRLWSIDQKLHHKIHLKINQRYQHLTRHLSKRKYDHPRYLGYEKKFILYQK